MNANLCKCGFSYSVPRNIRIIETVVSLEQYVRMSTSATNDYMNLWYVNGGHGNPFGAARVRVDAEITRAPCVGRARLIDRLKCCPVVNLFPQFFERCVMSG